MPIPKPKQGEKQGEFITRCMGSEVMKRRRLYRDPIDTTTGDTLMALEASSARPPVKPQVPLV